jgi:hypothetical protein
MITRFNQVTAKRLAPTTRIMDLMMKPKFFTLVIFLWFGGAKGPLLGSLCGEPVEIPGPGNDVYQLYWQTDNQFIWYTGQLDNPDDYFNSKDDWTLFRGSLNGEITELWQYRGFYPSY